MAATTSNAYGILSIAIFYAVILVVGIVVSKRRKRKVVNHSQEEMILADRSIGLTVGIFTMAATWMGGGTVFGTVEKVYASGLVNCTAPVCYALSLVLGGILFAYPMRSRNYVTMLEPLTEKFGQRVGSILLIPILPKTLFLAMAELFSREKFWFATLLFSAAGLIALGGTIALVINVNYVVSVIISAVTVLVYTVFGGLIAVAYTDVIQLTCFFAGTLLTLPFILKSEFVSLVAVNSSSDLFGTFESANWLTTLDSILMLSLGTMMCQEYFQRVLSSKSPRMAVITSCIAGFLYLVLVIPIMLMGIAGRLTDWQSTDYGKSISAGKQNAVFSYELIYLTPDAVRFIGIGVIAAAVMSSSDSFLLAAATLISRDIWKTLIRPNASNREIAWLTKLSMLVITAISCAIACTKHSSIYTLVTAGSELLYAVAFPEFTCALFVPFANSYGALSGFAVGIILRFLSGFQELGIPSVIKYPETGFPFKTIIMLTTATTVVGVSAATRIVFQHVSATKWDFLKCFTTTTDCSIDLDQQR